MIKQVVILKLNKNKDDDGQAILFLTILIFREEKVLTHTHSPLIKPIV